MIASTQKTLLLEKCLRRKETGGPHDNTYLCQRL
jgi:hypothetical protein